MFFKRTILIRRLLMILDIEDSQFVHVYKYNSFALCNYNAASVYLALLISHIYAKL